MRPHVCVTLDDAVEAESLRVQLEAQGWQVGLVTGPDAEVPEQGQWDVIVAEAEPDGMDLVQRCARAEPPPAVILLSTFGTIQEAVQALQRGAFDFIARPASAEQVALSVQRAREQLDLRAENLRLRRSVAERFQLGRFTTRDAHTRRVLELVESVAPTRATVLLQGESGTGKSLLARVLHERSDRSAGPFVVVNCGALPGPLLESELFGHVRGAFTGAQRDKPGRFEEADGGTLFLDEISTASPELQVKLLRAVQDRVIERLGSNEPVEVDVRFVFASNRDLAGEVALGRFREDLYWRIHVVALSLPPLRERSGDVALLAEGFLTRYAAEYKRPALRFHPSALAWLCKAPWPGNVRQLENTVERGVLLARGEEILPGDLDNELAAQLLAPAPQSQEAAAASYGPFAPGQTPPPLREALAGPERSILLQALELCAWNRQATAAMLGINRTTLFNKMHKYELFALEAQASASALPASRQPGHLPRADAI
jgi:DNA-binding NtrC family response regulator